MQRLKEILFESDMTLSCFLLGLGLVMWGSIAMLLSPKDMYSFADAVKSTTFLFWCFNYYFAGFGLMYISYKKFPHPETVLIGAFCAIMWTWIASIRGSSNFTAGVTLNWIVITMGVLLLANKGHRK